MQYHIQTLVKHLFDKDSFEQVTVQELKQFAEDYPYAAVGQYLYAKKLKDSGSYNHYEQSEQASLYFHNALWLRWQLDQKEEAPVLPVKAEETAQQPGFRIVVQMPKTAPAIVSTKPPAPPPPLTEQPEQPAASATAAAVPEEPVAEEQVAEEQGNSLQVNEAGSLVVTETAAEQPAPSPANAAETASAVAIAETSQLAEESIPAETPVNAVSITSEVLTPAAGATETTANQEADDIVPAVEVPAEMVDINTVKEEVDDVVPAVEATDRFKEETDDIVPAVEVTDEIREAVPTVSEEAAAETITTENQPVEAVIEPVAAAGTAIITAETEQPATEEPVVDNTTDRPVAEEPVQAEPEAAKAQPFQTIPGIKEGQTTVDLGEPIFESYHTIDYFASQGIKLGQHDFKDKMGKQLKSFTDWLRSMKRIGPLESNTSLDEVTNQSIQRIAEHSVEEKEVVTEAMAEVWAKQGNTAKAIRIYAKLSLLNPAKSTYFASRIEQLKAQ
jgi:hypothetical protein